jgi:hypothetical protein
MIQGTLLQLRDHKSTPLLLFPHSFLFRWLVNFLANSFIFLVSGYDSVGQILCLDSLEYINGNVCIFK